MSGAKNPLFRADPEPTAEGTAPERRGRADRRAQTGNAAYAGADRRQGPRRSADLPRPFWHHPLAVGLALALGIATGVSLSARESEPVVEPARAIEARVDPVQLEGVRGLRDQAEALTAASVALDERAHELWMPRVAKIELALADPQTPAAIRDELDATLFALERVGVLRP